MPEVVDELPPCHLRANCRWWQQKGKATCMRCLQIILQTYYPPQQLSQAADPAIVYED